MRPAIIAVVLTVVLIASRVEAAPFDFYCGKTFITFRPATAPGNLVTQRKADIEQVTLIDGDFTINIASGVETMPSIRVYVLPEFYKAFVECLD